MAAADPQWATECQVGGLASGEGLIHAVRDGLARTIQASATCRADGVTFTAGDQGAWETAG